MTNDDRKFWAFIWSLVAVISVTLIVSVGIYTYNTNKIMVERGLIQCYTNSRDGYIWTSPSSCPTGVIR